MSVNNIHYNINLTRFIERVIRTRISARLLKLVMILNKVKIINGNPPNSNNKRNIKMSL